MKFDDLEWEKEGNKLIVFNPKDLSFFELSDTGADIWELLTKSKNVSEIVEVISNKYSEDKSVVKKDVEEFIKELEKIF